MNEDKQQWDELDVISVFFLYTRSGKTRQTRKAKSKLVVTWHESNHHLIVIRIQEKGKWMLRFSCNRCVAKVPRRSFFSFFLRFLSLANLIHSSSFLFFAIKSNRNDSFFLAFSFCVPLDFDLSSLIKLMSNRCCYSSLIKNRTIGKNGYESVWLSIIE